MVRLGLTFVQNHRLVVELETDSLTGLANRGKLLYDLDRVLRSEDAQPYRLAILDLDGFKAYTDAFGHPAGDALLVRLGHQLAKAVGDRGTAYRMGGDEFAMLIRGDAEAAAVVEAGAEALSEWGQAGGQPLPRTDLTLRAKSPVVKHIGSANSSIVSDPSQL